MSAHVVPLHPIPQARPGDLAFLRDLLGPASFARLEDLAAHWCCNPAEAATAIISAYVDRRGCEQLTRIDGSEVA
jgi:hypothetical protein